MNKEQQELVDEVYKNYFIKKSSETGPFGIAGIIPTKEEFIYDCKTDLEFSEKWGLTIEERELSLKERLDLLKKLEIFQERVIDNAKSEMIHSLADSHSIPTKLITITYNDKKIESYE
jgi:hypothetical protein